MKKRIVMLVLIASIAFPISAFSLEYLWTDKYGRRVYDCGGFVVGGRAIVKDKGYGVYRVKGVLINREIHAESILHAARIACGEEEEPKPEQKQPAEEYSEE